MQARLKAATSAAVGADDVSQISLFRVHEPKTVYDAAYVRTYPGAHYIHLASAVAASAKGALPLNY